MRMVLPEGMEQIRSLAQHLCHSSLSKVTAYGKPAPPVMGVIGCRQGSLRQREALEPHLLSAASSKSLNSLKLCAYNSAKIFAPTHLRIAEFVKFLSNSEQFCIEFG
jgi:hypothetical protein